MEEKARHIKIMVFIYNQNLSGVTSEISMNKSDESFELSYFYENKGIKKSNSVALFLLHMMRLA